MLNSEIKRVKLNKMKKTNYETNSHQFCYNLFFI